MDTNDILPFAGIELKSEIQAKEMHHVRRYSSLSLQSKGRCRIDRRIREEFVPIVKKAKGFVRYYWLDTDKGEGASVGVFKDKAGADESVELAADYVR